MISVFPLLFHICRSQFSTILFGKEEIPEKYRMWINLGTLMFETIIGMTYTNIGTICGIVGSFCGLFIVYIAPISVHLKRKYV